MGVSTEFDLLEFQLQELIGEFRSVSASETRLREALRSEATRAETAEAALAAAERSAAEARNCAAAAAAGATQATAELSTAYEQLTGVKMQVELQERQRIILEEKCNVMTGQIKALERELQQLRPLQSTQGSLQRQYTELQERVLVATEEAEREASRLESELRRVERCAAGGSEIRERARLAATAHARERRLAAAELQHTIRELRTANVEITKLSYQVSELQLRLTQMSSTKGQHPIDPDLESLEEVRSAFEAERAGTEKLEKALAAALEDNATLAVQIRSKDTTLSMSQVQTPMPVGCSANTNICEIDSFLAD